MNHLDGDSNQNKISNIGDRQELVILLTYQQSLLLNTTSFYK